MNLNSNKRVMLCTKALYAEQLKCYASLCECYEKLASCAGRNATADDVQAKYSTYLTLASEGDLSFLERENNYIFSEQYQGARFQRTESNIFREYAKQSEMLRQFKDAAAILADAICVDGPPYEDAVEDYRKYMKRTSPETKKFDREISEHSPAYIGHTYYRTSRESLKAIQSIDSSHLDGLPVSKTLAPEQFGANISGFTTINRLMEATKQDARTLDTNEERREYAQKPSFIQEAGYRFFAKNQRGMALSLAAIIALGGITGVGSAIKTAHDYNKLSIDTLQEQGYKIDLSSETISSIQDVERLVQDLQSQSTIPTKDQLYEVGETIDDLFDVILEEKIAPSFLESHPGATNVSVDHYYNFHDANDPYKAIIISYTDSNGKQQEERATSFSSVGFLTPNDVSDVFDHEYDVDASYGDISKLFSSGNYTDNGKDATKILDGYSGNIEFMKHLAALDLSYKDGSLFGILPASVKADFPEKDSKSSNTRTIDDDDAR